MAKRALLVGIDQYDNYPRLSTCINDAKAMRTLLERHEDDELNYFCKVLGGPGSKKITRTFLKEQWQELFQDFDGDVVFYFSGHGAPEELDGFLVTQDGEPGDPGLSMNDLLTLTNIAHARSVLLILDCCFSGKLGNPANLQGGGKTQAQLREGLTILAASRPVGIAKETVGHGVFTKLVLEALSGGAADIRGRVSAAAIYAFAEQALGPWDQRPLYKTHADRLPPVRRCKPAVPDALLRELEKLFETPGSTLQMDPSFEVTESTARPENVERFEMFKQLRNARLLSTHQDKDLYYVALESKTIQLTPLGQFYWHLAKQRKI